MSTQHNTTQPEDTEKGMYKDEKIYICTETRMVTIKRTQNRIYITGYCIFEGEWAYSWTVETSHVMEFGLEDI